MAYPTLRATSSGKVSDPDEIVCTHPAGLTAGDTMLLAVGSMTDSTHNLDTPTDWTAIADYHYLNRERYVVFKKIATAGDVSAGSTTVIIGDYNSPDPISTAYCMLAFTGTASGSEVTPIENDYTDFVSSASTHNVTTALTPIVTQSVLVSFLYINDYNLANELTSSSFSVTPTTPMTKRAEQYFRDSSSDGFTLFAFTGEYSGTTQITGVSITISEATTHCLYATNLLVNAPQNATASNALLESSPVTFSPLTGSTQAPNSEFKEVSPEIFVQSAQAVSKTQWVNETKLTTSWNNDTV